MFVEKTMAVCEGKWATVIKSVVEGGILPQGDSVGDLLAFVTFLAVRVPRIRNEVADLIDRASKAELRTTLGTRDGHERFRAVIDQHCQTLPKSERMKIERLLRDDPNLTGMVDYVTSDRHTVRFDQTWDIHTIVRMAIMLLPVLRLRKWAVWRVAPDAPSLICADAP